jgi:hypothetical protein
MAISEFQAKEFMQWFSKDENRGFYAYDSSPIMFLTRDLVQYYHEVSYEKLLKKNDWQDSDQVAYNKVVTMALDLKQVYQELSGEEFVFDAWCNRDNDLCNQRRKAEGNHNHKHRLDLEPVSSMLKNTYDEAIELRKQCQALGINPSTGLVSDIAERSVHFDVLYDLTSIHYIHTCLRVTGVLSIARRSPTTLKHLRELLQPRSETRIDRRFMVRRRRK